MYELDGHLRDLQRRRSRQSRWEDLHVSTMPSSKTGTSITDPPGASDWEGGVILSGLDMEALANSVERLPGADKVVWRPRTGDWEVELVLLCGEVTASESGSALGLLCHSRSLGRVLRKDWRRALRRCALE